MTPEENWLEGFEDLKKGQAALPNATDVFDQALARPDPATTEIAQALTTPLLQATETPLETGDADLMIRLGAMVDPDAGQSLAEEAMAAPVPGLSLAELKACADEEHDEPLAAWRATRMQGRIANPELLPPALHAAAETLAKSFAWDDARAFMTAPSQAIDPASATRGGPAGILRLSEQMDAGRIARDEAVQLAAQLGVGDDDLAFLIAVPGHAPERGPRLLGGLLELVGTVAQDNLFAARCLRTLSAFTGRDGTSDETWRLLDQAAARLAGGADPALRAEVLNEQAVGLSNRGSFQEALVKAHEARALALDCGASSIARMALGSVGHALLALDCPDEALNIFKQLEAEQEAAHEHAELDATRFNMEMARMRLGQLNAPALPEASSDPEHAFRAAHDCAQEGLSAFEQAVVHTPDASDPMPPDEAGASAGQTNDALPVPGSVTAAAGDADARDRVAALAGRAEELRVLGRPREALRDLQEANQTAASLEPSELTANVRACLGWVLIETGAIAEGILAAEDALQLARDLKADRLEIIILNNLGRGLHESGDPTGARASFEAARDRARATSSAEAEATALFGLGNVAASGHKTTEAQSHYRQASEMAAQAHNTRLEAEVLDSLALLHLRDRDPARAIDLQKRAAELHKKLGDWNGHVTDLVNLISSYVLLREADHAAATLREAKAVVRKHPLPHLAPILQVKAAQIGALRGDWPSARKSYRAGLRQLESEEVQLSTPAAQRRWRSRRAEAYALAVEDAVLAGDAPAAVEFLEANRTQFYERFHLCRSRASGVTEEVMRQHEVAADRLEKLRRQRRASRDRADAALEADLAEARAHCESLRCLMDTADPAAPSAPPFEFPTFKSLAHAIPRGHATVSISLQNRGTAVVCVGRSDAGKVWTSTRMEPALDGAHLQELVLGDAEAWRQAGSPADIPDAALGWARVTQVQAPELWQRALRHVATELGTRLWPMIEGAIEGRTHRLILMPGAGFAVLPLHAALLADGTRAQDRFEIRYTPSLSLFQRASRSAPVGLATSLKQLIPPSPELPFALLEAARVARHFAAANQAQVEGLMATPDAALGLLESPGIFHFNGHAALDSNVGSSRVDLQACKLEYSIVSPK